MLFRSTPTPQKPTTAHHDVHEPNTESPRVEQPPPPPQTWLTKKIKEDPAAKRVFFALLKLLGYGSAKQYAGRRAFAMYSQLCVPRPEEESAFWKNGEPMYLCSFRPDDSKRAYTRPPNPPSSWVILLFLHCSDTNVHANTRR